MGSENLWDRYCALYRVFPELGLSLDISRMRFPETLFSTHAAGMAEAFKTMDELEKGSIANPDEGRMVGHYWLRTPDLSPNAEIKKEIIGAIENIKSFARALHSGEIKPTNAPKFEYVVIVGIGGSALGPQLVADALGSREDKMKVLFCDNTDPDGIQRSISQLGDRLKSTLVITISKSGGTVETRNGALEFAQAFSAQKLAFGPHSVAVTCEGSKLDQQATKEGWLKRFPLWDWVGGRTSLFSPVGLLPAALQGINIDAFLEGARKMDAITRVQDVQRNPAALLALMWYFSGEGKGKKDMVVLPYKDRLVLFSKYLQQLVMESLGKEKNLKGELVNQGIAVYGNKGSTDQHAYVQQLRDGLNNFFATFIQVQSDYVESASSAPLEVEPGITSGDYLTGFFLGTRTALYENKRDSITISIDTLNPETLGALIAMYDRTVGFYASLVGINAYHQPGVEAGKKAATKVIDLQRAIVKSLGADKSPRTAAEIASAIGSADDAETVFQVLEHLSSNHRAMREGERHPAKAKYRAN